MREYVMSNRIHENKLKKDLYKENLTVSKNIKFLRLIYGYSQQEISDMLRMSRGAYVKMENGGKQLDFEILAALSDFYDVDITYLVSYDICDQMLNMIRVDQEAVRASSFIESFFHLSRNGKEQIRSVVYEIAEHEKEFKRFPWNNEKYNELYDTDVLRNNRFFYERKFNKGLRR